MMMTTKSKRRKNHSFEYLSIIHRTLNFSHVKVDTVVRYKSFGSDIVVEIENDMITVAFGKAEKKFKFFGVFKDGF